MSHRRKDWSGRSLPGIKSQGRRLRHSLSESRRTMKSVTASALLLILLGVAWRGDSHSWVGTEGKWGGGGGPQDGRTWGQLSSDSKGP